MPKKEIKQANKKTASRPKTKAPPEKSVKEPKPPKLRNIRNMMLLRNVVIAVLLIIFVIGVFMTVRAFTRGDGTQTVRAEVKTGIAALRSDFDTQTEAKAFAQNFIKDYFTYQNRDINEYRDRLGKYCTPKLVGEMLESVIIKDSANALYAQAVDLLEYTKDQYDITVVVDVLYTRPAADQNNSVGSVAPEATVIPQDETTKSTFYIIVPVWSDGQGGYVIEDIPRLTAPLVAAGYNRLEFSGTSASDADKTDSQQMLNDFFKTLYSDPQNKIDYYLSDDAKAEKFAALDLGANMVFQKIEKLTLYKTAVPNEFTALVTIRISDLNGTDIRQRFNMQLIKKDKFYAKDIDLRTYNLR